jgi:hypothetical protein
MADKTLKEVKDEIRFFMERSFQVSFAYLGALAVTVLSARSDAVSSIASTTGLEAAVILIGLLLLNNFVYLSIAMSCHFALLKRGMFILLSEENGDRILIDWERFLRRPNRFFREFGWNIDNYYLAPVDFLVAASSVALVGYQMTRLLLGQDPHRIQEIGVILLPAILHVWPIWSFIQLVKLMRVQRKLVRHIAMAPQTLQLNEFFAVNAVDKKSGESSRH